MGWKFWERKDHRHFDPVTQELEVDDHGQFYFYERLRNGKHLRYCNSDAYSIATNLSEVFNPIDIISDRVAGVDYFLSDLEGNRIENVPTNIKRLLHKPNPFQNLSQLVYQMQFTKLATGGLAVYPTFAKSFKTKDTDYLSNLWVLNPDYLEIKPKREIGENIFLIRDYSELIEEYRFRYGCVKPLILSKDDVIYFVDGEYDWNKFKVISPLNASERNINNLLAVYSARYNAYENNGASGIIARKAMQNEDMAQFDNDSKMRKKMIKEMNMSDGITGGKNFIGVSSYPLEFIRTIGTIKELEPFTETFHDQVAIAGIFGVSKHLLPIAEGTTFTNQKDAEVHLWQNTIKPYAHDIANELSKCLYLDETKFKISCSFEDVEVLQADRKVCVETDLLEVDLYERLKLQGIDNQSILDKWRK